MEGSQEECLYVIKRGSIRVSTKGAATGTVELGVGQVFGEQCFVKKKARRYTAVCDETVPSLLLCLPLDVLKTNSSLDEWREGLANGLPKEATKGKKEDEPRKKRATSAGVASSRKSQNERSTERSSAPSPVPPTTTPLASPHSDKTVEKAALRSASMPPASKRGPAAMPKGK